MKTIDELVKWAHDESNRLINSNDNVPPECQRWWEWMEIDDFADDVLEAWNYEKAHPEKWCNCDQCVCNNDHDIVTLKAALLRIVNYINQNEKLTDGERLFTVEKIARCALARFNMHSISNDPTTCKVIEDAYQMARNKAIKESESK